MTNIKPKTLGIFVILLFHLIIVNVYSQDILEEFKNSTLLPKSSDRCGELTIIPSLQLYELPTTVIELNEDDVKDFKDIKIIFPNYQIEKESIQVTPGYRIQICRKNSYNCIQIDNSSNIMLLEDKQILVDDIEYVTCFKWDRNVLKSCTDVKLAKFECFRAFFQNNCGNEQPPLSILKDLNLNTAINSSMFNLDNFSIVFDPTCVVQTKLKGLPWMKEWALLPTVNETNWCNAPEANSKLIEQKQSPCRNFKDFKLGAIDEDHPLLGFFKCICDDYEFTTTEIIPNGKHKNLLVYVSVGVSIAIILIAGIAIYFVRRSSKRNMNELSGINIDKDWKSLLEIEIPRRKFTIDYEILGEGNIGIVFKGVMKKCGRQVAIKTVKKPFTEQNVTSLLNEVKLMQYVGIHPNIISLVGASTSKVKQGKVYCIVEICQNGSLKQYLQNMHRKLLLEHQSSCQIILSASELQSNDYLDIPIQARSINKESINYELELLKIQKLIFKWSEEIASAMAFLGSKNVIHVDLAARNVLLTEQLTAKITDFGLSRKLYDCVDYQKTSNERVPWKWLSMESLMEKKFSAKSDVWSYGITIWELLNLVQTEPYSHINSADQLFTFLCNGNRLPKPKYSDTSTFDILKKCWSEEPDNRPDFNWLEEYFNTVQQSLTSDNTDL